jgi:hypothetical protein
MLFTDNENYLYFKNIFTENLIKDKLFNTLYSNYKKQIQNVLMRKQVIDMILTGLKVFIQTSKLKTIMPPISNIISSLSDIGVNEELMSSKFIDNNIRNDIISCIKKYNCMNTHIELKINEMLIIHVNNVNGNIFTEINTNSLCDFILNIVNFLLQYSSIKVETTINIFIFPTKHKKVFNTDYDTSLTSKNINSGITSKRINSVNNKNIINIIIYRYEECYKVLLHELIHSLGLDLGFICNIQNKKIKNVRHKIKSMLNADNTYNDGNLLLEESVCEFWTIFIYTLFYSIERSVDIKKSVKSIIYDNKIIKNISKILINRYTDEYLYNIIKIINIVHYHTNFYDLTNNKTIILSGSLDIMFKSIDSNENISIIKRIVSSKLRETNTSLYEYTIIKTMMMTNIDLFFKFRENYINPINVNCSHKQIYEILLFILVCITNNYDKTNKYYKNISEILKLHKNKLLFNSLCLSMFS